MRALLAHFLVGLAQGQALAVRRDEEGGNPAGARGVLIRAGKDGEQLGVGRIGDIALAPIDDEAVSLAIGPGAHRARIGAGVRLGEGEGADDLAAGHAR